MNATIEHAPSQQFGDAVTAEAEFNRLAIDSMRRHQPCEFSFIHVGRGCFSARLVSLFFMKVGAKRLREQ